MTCVEKDIENSIDDVGAALRRISVIVEIYLVCSTFGYNIMHNFITLVRAASFFYNGITFYSFLGSDICRPAAMCISLSHLNSQTNEKIAEIQTHKCGMQIVVKCR